MSIADQMADMEALTDDELAGVARWASLGDDDVCLMIAAAASRYLISQDWDEAWAFVADEFDRYDEFIEGES